MEASEIFLGQDFNIEQYPAEFLLIRIGYLLLLFFLTTALINYSLHSFLGQTFRLLQQVDYEFIRWAVVSILFFSSFSHYLTQTLKLLTKYQLTIAH